MCAFIIYGHINGAAWYQVNNHNTNICLEHFCLFLCSRTKNPDYLFPEEKIPVDGIHKCGQKNVTCTDNIFLLFTSLFSTEQHLSLVLFFGVNKHRLKQVFLVRTQARKIIRMTQKNRIVCGTRFCFWLSSFKKGIPGWSNSSFLVRLFIQDGHDA